MCTWVKNGYRSGDVFGCHSLGEEGAGKGGEKVFEIKKNNCFLLNNFFPVTCKLLQLLSLIGRKKTFVTPSLTYEKCNEFP